MHKVDPKIKTSATPRAVASIDQLESPVPGFILIAKGQPTTCRYRGATIFVDDVSDFSYVHLNCVRTTQETHDAKHAFECVAEQHGVHICHYHCDIGHFADCALMENICQVHQTLRFVGLVLITKMVWLNNTSVI